MLDIQFLPYTNTSREAVFVGGKVFECTKYCKGDKLIIASLPANTLVIGGYGIIKSPNGDTIDITIEVGVSNIGHNMSTLHWNGINEARKFTIPPIVTLTKENITVSLNEALPALSSIEIMIECIFLDVIEDEYTVVTTPECGCDTQNCDVYKDMR